MVLLEAQIQLVPDGTLLIHLFMVAVMVFILNRTLLKPVNRILAERERQVEGRLQEAQMMAAETEEKLNKYNNALREARASLTYERSADPPESKKRRKAESGVYAWEWTTAARGS